MAVVTKENWRAERDHFAEVFDHQELPGVAERLREIGWAETRGFEVDDAYCADILQKYLARASRQLVCVEDVGFNAGCADPFAAWRGGFPVCERHRDRYDWDVSASALLATQPAEVQS